MSREHFFPKQPPLRHQTVNSNPPKQLYHQQTDWTCSIASIRSLLSGICEQVPGEQELVERFRLKPGPHYSKDIKRIGILEGYDVVYGCDQKDADFDTVLDLMENGYYVMVESMYNFAHWYVLMGYYPIAGEDIEKSTLLIYDPYYHNTRLLNTDEFIGMWIDGNFAASGVERDFIAIQK